MTLVQLSNNELALFSPVSLTEQDRIEINKLGKVRYLIAPNVLHYVFMNEVHSYYPQAKVCAPLELIQKKRDLNYSIVLNQQNPCKDDLEMILFDDGHSFKEYVFYHKLSKTLIVTDLIENTDPEFTAQMTKMIYDIAALIDSKGEDMSKNFKHLSGYKKNMQKQILDLIDLEPKHLIMAHGANVQQRGTKFLKDVFSWLIV
jgi:uncharacterized membrane protein